MTATTPDIVDLTGLDRDWEIPCDYNSQRRTWAKGVTLHGVSGGGVHGARWVVFVKCPDCGHTAQYLGCGPCKDYILATPDAVGCIGCEKTHAPYRKIVDRIEPLTKGSE